MMSSRSRAEPSVRVRVSLALALIAAVAACNDEKDKSGNNGTENPSSGFTDDCGIETDGFCCDDGTVIQATVVCNRQFDCPDGEDEAPDICGYADSCCAATRGCPLETGDDCGLNCCCCGVGQTCCPDWSGCCDYVEGQ